MKTKTATAALALVLLCSTAPALAATPHTQSTRSTPDACIELNAGDWNACNVGHSGAGNLPYLPVHKAPRTPDECIKLNGGDWNACNVGNSGAGDLPYLTASR